MTNTLSLLKSNLIELYRELSEDNFEISSKLFVKTIELRNLLSQENGFVNYLDMQLKKNGVPEEDWNNYLKNRSQIKSKVGSSEPNRYPHFLSKLTPLDLDFPSGVLALFREKISPELFNRIDLVSGGERAFYNYSPETDRYTITIPNSNHNQKIAMFIHELSHVIDSEANGKIFKNRYQNEKSALKGEFLMTRSLSNDFYEADLSEYLACFVRTEFEEIIYFNPREATPENFSNIYSKYYGESDEKLGFLYLLDRKIVDKPFVDLSATVAIANLLRE